MAMEPAAPMPVPPSNAIHIPVIIIGSPKPQAYEGEAKSKAEAEIIVVVTMVSPLPVVISAPMLMTYLDHICRLIWRDTGEARTNGRCRGRTCGQACSDHSERSQCDGFHVIPPYKRKWIALCSTCRYPFVTLQTGLLFHLHSCASAREQTSHDHGCLRI
jgi:hypothetical protein